jgi:ubiquinol-cytochrome c reductase cytochrome c1 subunit
MGVALARWLGPQLQLRSVEVMNMNFWNMTMAPIPGRQMRVAVAALALCATSTISMAAGDAIKIERNQWSFSGLFGQFDQAQLQRGFQVYQEVCTSCHGLKRMYFRNLVQAGGPQFPEESVKALAASWPNKIHDGPNDNGEIADKKGNLIKRAPRLADPILGPYDNDNQARSAQNGALPPDLSLMARARGVEYTGSLAFHPISMIRDVATGYQEGGADYIYALLMGYADQAPAHARDKAGRLAVVADKDVRDEKAVERCATVAKGEDGAPDVCNKLQDGMYYNKYFPGGQIAMPAPLSSPTKYQANAGAPSTIDQNAKDLTAFLAWTADPKLSERKRIGWQVILYLLITSVLLFIAKKRVWKSLH